MLEMTKAELRRIYLAKRQTLSEAERDALSLQIAQNVFTNFDLDRIDFLHCYISIGKFREIDTRPIFEWIWSEFPRVQALVPKVNYETGEIESLKYGSETELAQSQWQIHEPIHNEIVEADRVDIVIVPLVCFDRRGHRVGYGKGFYDRFLGRCRPDCLKVGLSFFGPVDEIADAHGGDVRLDFCVTPQELYQL